MTGMTPDLSLQWPSLWLSCDSSPEGGEENYGERLPWILLPTADQIRLNGSNSWVYESWINVFFRSNQSRSALRVPEVDVHAK